jgi:hypothetical protein
MQFDLYVDSHQTVQIILSQLAQKLFKSACIHNTTTADASVCDVLTSLMRIYCIPNR